MSKNSAVLLLVASLMILAGVLGWLRWQDPPQAEATVLDCEPGTEMEEVITRGMAAYEAGGRVIRIRVLGREVPLSISMAKGRDPCFLIEGEEHVIRLSTYELLYPGSPAPRGDAVIIVLRGEETVLSYLNFFDRIAGKKRWGRVVYSKGSSLEYKSLKDRDPFIETPMPPTMPASRTLPPADSAKDNLQ